MLASAQTEELIVIVVTLLASELEQVSYRMNTVERKNTGMNFTIDEEFDLDIRLSAPQGSSAFPQFCNETWEVSCDTCWQTCDTCVNTCGGSCYSCYCGSNPTCANTCTGVTGNPCAC